MIAVDVMTANNFIPTGVLGPNNAGMLVVSPSTMASSSADIGSAASMAPAAAYLQVDEDQPYSVQHDYHDRANELPVQNEDGSTMRRGGVTTPFPFKLHKMLSQVEKEGLSNIVSWQPHGRCFVVRKPKEFASMILPRFFRQTKFASFQRQLNMYGFLRLTKGADASGYYHEFFLRDRDFLCHRIRRIKLKGTGVRLASSPETEPNFYAMPFVSTSMQSIAQGSNTSCISNSLVSSSAMMCPTLDMSQQGQEVPISSGISETTTPALLLRQHQETLPSWAMDVATTASFPQHNAPQEKSETAMSAAYLSGQDPHVGGAGTHQTNSKPAGPQVTSVATTMEGHPGKFLKDEDIFSGRTFHNVDATRNKTVPMEATAVHPGLSFSTSASAVGSDANNKKFEINFVAGSGAASTNSIIQAARQAAPNADVASISADSWSQYYIEALRKAAIYRQEVAEGLVPSIAHSTDMMGLSNNFQNQPPAASGSGGGVIETLRPQARQSDGPNKVTTSGESGLEGQLNAGADVYGSDQQMLQNQLHSSGLGNYHGFDGGRSGH